MNERTSLRRPDRRRPAIWRGRSTARKGRSPRSCREYRAGHCPWRVVRYADSSPRAYPRLARAGGYGRMGFAAAEQEFESSSRRRVENAADEVLVEQHAGEFVAAPA